MALSLSTQARQNIVGSLRGALRVTSNFSAGSVVFVMVSDAVQIPNGTTQTMFSYVNQVLNFSTNDGGGSGNRANILGLAFSSKANLPTDSFTDGDSINLTGPWNFTALQSGTIGSVMILKRIDAGATANGSSDPTLPISTVTSAAQLQNSTNYVGIAEGVTSAGYTTTTYSASYGSPDPAVVSSARGMYISNGGLIVSSLNASSTMYSNFAGCTNSIGLNGSGAICEISSLTLSAGTSYVFNSFCLSADRI